MKEREGINKTRVYIIIVIILNGVSMYTSSNNLLAFKYIHSLPIMLSILLSGLIFYEFILEEPLLIRILNTMIIAFYLAFVIFLFRYIYYKVELGRLYVDGEVIIVEEDVLGEKYYYRKKGMLKEEKTMGN